MRKNEQKSITLSLGLSTAWRTVPHLDSKTLQAPVGPDKVGHVQNFAAVAGPLALTVTLSRVVPVPLLAAAPASLLVDPRGRAL